MGALADLSFEEWVEHAFAHEVRFQRPEWYWDEDCDYWSPEPRQAVRYLTRLFADAPEHLKWFSDAQVAQGLAYLVDCSVGMQSDLGNRAVPASERAQLWAAVAIFFRDYLKPRCEPILSHIDEGWTPLNSRTYMWWEGFPYTYALDEPDFETVMHAEIAALDSILGLDCVACQEAALHGLGHMARREPMGALSQRLIAEYLERGQFARPELERYARAAQTGCIQ